MQIKLANERIYAVKMITAAISRTLIRALVDNTSGLKENVSSYLQDIVPGYLTMANYTAKINDNNLTNFYRCEFNRRTMNFMGLSNHKEIFRQALREHLVQSV